MDEDVVSTLRADPTMARLLGRHGRLPVEPVDDEFRRLCVSVLNQQLSTASATAIRERAFDVLDGEVTPERVIEADPEALRAVGVSRTKTEYLRAIAEAFRDRNLTHEGFSGRPDGEVVSELTEIYGVGEWTARMYLIAALGREDVLPLGDLAVRKGIENLYNDGKELRRTEMRDIAESWRPYRSYGTRYVWAEYES